MVTDCEFLGGAQGSYNALDYFTNCLFDRSGIWLDNSSTTYPLIYMRNCTMHGGSVWFSHRGGVNWYSSVRDCAFDGTSLSIEDNSGGNSAYVDYDYNAYTNSTDPFPAGGTHDKKSVVFNWQTGPLGRYCLPWNSALIDAGSQTADLVGLYHFTTQLSEVKETNSTVAGATGGAITSASRRCRSNSVRVHCAPHFLRRRRKTAICCSLSFSSGRFF